jgi:hypothetical protein
MKGTVPMGIRRFDERIRFKTRNANMPVEEFDFCRNLEMQLLFMDNLHISFSEISHATRRFISTDRFCVELCVLFDQDANLDSRRNSSADFRNSHKNARVVGGRDELH